MNPGKFSTLSAFVLSLILCNPGTIRAEDNLSGSNVLTLLIVGSGEQIKTWEVSRKEASDLPRWNTIDSPPISIEDVVSIVRNSGLLPPKSRLVNVSLRSVPKQKDAPDIENIFYYVVEFASIDSAEIYAFVVLPNRVMVKERISKLSQAKDVIIIK